MRCCAKRHARVAQRVRQGLLGRRPMSFSSPPQSLARARHRRCVLAAQLRDGRAAATLEVMACDSSLPLDLLSARSSPCARSAPAHPRKQARIAPSRAVTDSRVYRLEHRLARRERAQRLLHQYDLPESGPGPGGSASLDSAPRPRHAVRLGSRRALTAGRTEHFQEESCVFEPP